MSRLRTTALAVLLIATGATEARGQGDYFVIVSSDTTRAEAKRRAVLEGTWVLETGLYPNLRANLYAVVLGPFASAEAAGEVLAFARGAYPDAYIRNAGVPPHGRSDDAGVPRVLVRALLGDVAVATTNFPGGLTSCEPQEAYVAVRSTEQIGDPTDSSSEFRIIARTGEARRVGPCALERYEQFVATLDTEDPYSISLALGYYRWHFRPTGLQPLNDSALVRFMDLYARVTRRYAAALREAGQEVLERLHDEYAPRIPPDSSVQPKRATDTPDTLAALWQVLSGNGLTVGLAGPVAPAYSPGYRVLEDPEYLKATFEDHVSPGMQEFLRLRREEQRVRATGGRYTFALGNALVTWENFLQSHPDFLLRQKAASYYRQRLEPYFVGEYRGPPVFRLEDGSSQYRPMYEWILSHHPNTETGKLTARYYEILRAGDFRCTSETEQFLFDLDLSDLVFGGRPLFPPGSREANLFATERLGGAVYIECHPDETGNPVRSGMLRDGRRYAILSGAQDDDGSTLKAWLVCQPLEEGSEVKRSPLLQYTLDDDELAKWAGALGDEDINKLAARYCS